VKEGHSWKQQAKGDSGFTHGNPLPNGIERRTLPPYFPGNSSRSHQKSQKKR
jgi:hypothetical protein